MENRNKKIIAVLFAFVMILSVGAVIYGSGNNSNFANHIQLPTTVGSGSGGSTSSTYISVDHACANATADSHNTYDVGETVTFTISVGSYVICETDTATLYYQGSDVASLSRKDTGNTSAISTTYSHTFASSGTKTFYVTLSGAYSGTGNKVDLYVNSDPSVSITTSANPVISNQSVTFNASASGGTTPYSYQWYVNGNAVSGATSSTYSPSFDVSAHAYENVNVTVKDATGYSVNSNTVNEIVNPPNLYITASGNPVVIGSTVTFYSHTNQSLVSKYNWSILGNTYTTQNAVQKFSNAGHYNASLHILTKYGQTIWTNYTITINMKVSITFTGLPVDTKFTFNFNSNPYTITNTSYNFFMNNGTYAFSTENINGYSYSAPSSIAVHGSNVSITVAYAKSLVSINSNHNPAIIGETVNFTFTSSQTGTLYGNWIVLNQTFNATYLNFQFNDSGIYRVELEVISSSGYKSYDNYTEDVQAVVTIKETGYPSGQVWGYDFNGISNFVNTTSVTLYEMNGNYTFSAKSELSSYSVTVSSSVVNVYRSNTTIYAFFTLNKFQLTVISDQPNSFNIFNNTYNATSTFTTHIFSNMYGTYTYSGIGLKNGVSGYFYNIAGHVDMNKNRTIYLNYTAFSDKIVISLTGASGSINIFANENFNVFKNVTITTGNSATIVINNYNDFPVSLTLNAPSGDTLSSNTVDFPHTGNYSQAITLSTHNLNNGINFLQGNMVYIMVALFLGFILILPIVVKKGAR